MVVALRRLVGAIRAAADEAAAMATEISASTEEMSASTEEIGLHVAGPLPARGGNRPNWYGQAADDAARILQIAVKLAQGAEETARRNADLAVLARRHKDGLDQSTVRLAKLADEVAKGAEEAEAVGASHGKIQTFVAQTKAVADADEHARAQCAIEAARARSAGTRIRRRRR